MFDVFPEAVPIYVCEQIIKDCKQNVLEQAEVSNSNRKSSRDRPDVRKTSVSFIKDKDNRINELAWHFLRKANESLFHYDLAFFQAIQFAEYKVGDFFDWHQDYGGISKSNEVRKLSLTLVLSDPDTFEGGELQFYNGGRHMEDGITKTWEQTKHDIQSQGTAIVFDSRDWHRVTPVTKGVRHSIVCWTVGPNFK